MANTKYNLRYLPIFYQDLEEKAMYIADKLQNVQAANELIDDVENAILKRVSCAESFEPYRSVKERRYNYYRIYVNNFTVYYVVIDDEGSKLWHYSPLALYTMFQDELLTGCYDYPEEA